MDKRHQQSESEWLSTEEAAALLDLDDRSVRNLAEASELRRIQGKERGPYDLPGFKYGARGQWRFRRTEVEALGRWDCKPAPAKD